MALQQNADPTQTRLPDVFASDKMEVDDAFRPIDDTGDGEDRALDMSDAEVLAYLGDAKRQARNYQQISVMAQWEYAEAAYRSEYSSGSKYKKDLYKNRAKYFKPKTRSAVKKALAATRAATMSQDIISCEASNDSDPVQRANAALLKEIINIRLTNKTRRSGIRWFQTTQGARRDCQVLGVCCSKQEWLYRVRKRTTVENAPVFDEDGQPVLDFLTGEPVMAPQQREVSDVLVDRPAVTLIPAEYVMLVPTAGWIDPAQDSPVMIVQHPMHIDAVRSMMGDEKSALTWRTITDEQIFGARYSDNDLNGIKIAREGADGASQTKQVSGQSNRDGMALDLIEVWECFFHVDGEDYHCWSLKNTTLLSDPKPTFEAYPAHRGSRPYVLGTDQIEPHVLYPDAPVFTWRQSQEEINDFTNLRMDATKQSIFPMAKVVAGRNVDYRAVQRRDSQGTVLVREPNDVTFDRPPGPSAQAYQEASLLANDFDEQAGNFSQNSVQSNRSLNETVGGMQIIAAAAGATTEYDLAVFIDTWMEPVISQLIGLTQYYEDDPTLLAVAGDKAKLWQRFGVSEVTDEMLESQVTVSVNVGIGGADPMMKLMKFKTIFEAAMPIMMKGEAEGRIKLNYEEMLGEIWGQGGYKNGAERFVEFSEQSEGPPDMPAEKVREMMSMMEAMKAELADLKKGDAVKLQIKAAELADKDKDRQARVMTEKMKLQAAQKSDWSGFEADMTLQQSDQDHDVNMWMLDHSMPAIPTIPLVGGY